MSQQYTLFFEEIDKKDLPLVGGKGANLGELTKAGFPVPRGFCVTTGAYQAFLTHNLLVDFISQAIKDATLDNISSIGDKIRSRLRLSQIPQQVEQEIISAIDQAGSFNYYAVRSSATAEDLPFASFAGQQDTYLNINGEKELLNAVRNCWASLFTDRAILYRIQNKIEHATVQMSVVIQKMIRPEVSGIMFTADPVSGHRGIVSIDASYGLGEALVSGLVSPDIYKFNKKHNLIENKTIADKKMAILPVKGGGTEKLEITGQKATSQVMSDATIIKLSNLGMMIETHYGCPQDIEWCLEQDTLYIVQSRAITSLFPLPSPIPEDDALHAYVSFNHFQVMTDPISPLGIDILRIILPFDKEAKSEVGYAFLKASAGRIYIDVSELLQYKKLRKGLPAFFRNVDSLLAEALIELIGRPDFVERIKKHKGRANRLRKYMQPMLVNTIKNLLFRKPEGSIEFMNHYIERRVKTSEERIRNSKPGIDRLDAIYENASFYTDLQILGPKLAPGIISFKMLENLELKLLGSKKYVAIIITGLEGNITTEMGLQVGDLADLIRKSPQLVREFENEDYRTLVARINQLREPVEFKQRFNAFMETYDMRAAGEIDMAKDRWVENPEPLVKSILATVRTSQQGAHRRDYNATIDRAKKATDDFAREVASKRGKLQGKLIKRLIRVCRNMLPVREHPKYLIMQLVMIFKRAFLEEARLLVQKGQLVEEKDVFFVSFWELRKAIETNESLIELVNHRKEDNQHYRKLSAPRVMTSDGEEIKSSYKRENLPEGALVGMPVSAGIIEGIAKVITDPTDSSINKGDILVAPFTDPGWTPLFINAAGLVMEIGGLLTHGTVVAREYGIPAVVGITDATKIIKTGQRIRVDGNAGFVMIIEE